MKHWQTGKQRRPGSVKTSDVEAVKSELAQARVQRTVSKRVTLGVPFISST